jgi:hypothetical protein
MSSATEGKPEPVAGQSPAMPPPERSWVTELRETVSMFGRSDMARLAVVSFYTGYNQPYQLVTFGNRFFSASTLGYLLALFYVADLSGSLVLGHLLDGSGSVTWRARAVMLGFVSASTVAYVIAFHMEFAARHDPTRIAHK